MAKEEFPLQIDLFSGEFVDNRSDYQKRKDKNRNAPQQLQMFKTPDMVQYGVSARPWLKDAPPPTLVLEIQDTRTPEEVERDLMREAEKHTTSFLDDTASENTASSEHENTETNYHRLSGVIFDAKNSWRPIGLSKRLRAGTIPVRSRRCPI